MPGINFYFEEMRQARSARGIVANVLVSYIVVSKFDVQSRKDIHFRTKTLEKSMTPLISAPSYVLKSTTRMILALDYPEKSICH